MVSRLVYVFVPWRRLCSPDDWGGLCCRAQARVPSWTGSYFVVLYGCYIGMQICSRQAGRRDAGSRHWYEHWYGHGTGTDIGTGMGKAFFCFFCFFPSLICLFLTAGTAIHRSRNFC